MQRHRLPLPLQPEHRPRQSPAPPRKHGLEPHAVEPDACRVEQRQRLERRTRPTTLETPPIPRPLLPGLASLEDEAHPHPPRQEQLPAGSVVPHRHQLQDRVLRLALEHRPHQPRHLLWRVAPGHSRGPRRPAPGAHRPVPRHPYLRNTHGRRPQAAEALQVQCLRRHQAQLAPHHCLDQGSPHRERERPRIRRRVETPYVHTHRPAGIASPLTVTVRSVHGPEAPRLKLHDRLPPVPGQHLQRHRLRIPVLRAHERPRLHDSVRRNHPGRARREQLAGARRLATALLPAAAAATFRGRSGWGACHRRHRTVERRDGRRVDVLQSVVVPLARHERRVQVGVRLAHRRRAQPGNQGRRDPLVGARFRRRAVEVEAEVRELGGRLPRELDTGRDAASLEGHERDDGRSAYPGLVGADVPGARPHPGVDVVDEVDAPFGGSGVRASWIAKLLLWR